MKSNISVVMPTYNAEKVIGPCLRSLEWADEIVIVDAFSKDSTLDICKQYPNVKVFQRQGYIFGNINFGVQKASHDWILRFDSDEVMTEELKNEILEVLKKEGAEYDGFYCKAQLFMFGKELKYGVGIYTYRKQLFKKGYAWYKVRSEHEEMTSKGKWGYLKNHYLHYNYRTLKEFLEKTEYYIRKDMERVKDITYPPVLITLCKCVRHFVLFYFQWQGFRDGLAGLLASFLRGPYYIWVEDRAKRYAVKNRLSNE